MSWFTCRAVFYIAAYRATQSLAVLLYFDLFVLNTLAISGTRGSSGFGSLSREQMDKSTEKQNNFTLEIFIVVAV